MKTRNFVLCALGLAAAITFGGAETASAQAQSQRRIPVRKDAPVEAPVAHVDTIRIVRVDTVTMRGRTDTVTIRMRPDTVMQMQMLPIQRLPGLYFGLGAGVAIPMNNRSARLFGMTGKRITSDRSAIYRLNYQDGSAHYQFHSARRTSEVAALRSH